MMFYSTPITGLVPRRYSCRAYRATPLEDGTRTRVAEFLASLRTGPLGSTARFELVAATEQDRQSLKGLGTYGSIRGAAGFIMGAVAAGPKDREDFAYLMERAVLLATDLDLDTCWLGGITKDSFARKIAAREGESVPAAAAIGYGENVERTRRAPLRMAVGAASRLPWARLFFDQAFGVPLTPSAAGDFAAPLEMVRLGPSAKNKQPCRIIRLGAAWHFYLQRTPGYRESLIGRLVKSDDLQRLDLGIAMCHFDLAASEAGLKGHWGVVDPGLAAPDEFTEYTASWMSEATAK